MRHVPKQVFFIITQSPLESDEETDGPTDCTSKQPSLPPTALGCGVPRREVNGGREGYTPWIWFMSAGFMGVARARRRTVEGGREGDIEWV